MNVLKAVHLSKQIKATQIVKDVSVEVKSGEVVGLLGPNGAGKTTTFYMICGLLRPSSGEVFLNDTDISNFPLHQRSNMGIGYLPQESSIFKELSVEENLMLSAEISIKNKKERNGGIRERHGADGAAFESGVDNCPPDSYPPRADTRRKP